MRQVGFQETDIVSIVKPLVKDAFLVTEPDKIRYYLEKAFHKARNGRPGPVLMDIPLNIQRADINAGTLKSFDRHTDDESTGGIERIAEEVFQLIKSSSRPVILAGGGVRLAKASGELIEFAVKTGIPIVSSLMGLDAFPHDENYFAGMIGTYGNRYANLTIANSDLVLVLGSRLDTRQTGTKPETFARGAKIVHVDIDPYELNNKVNADMAVNCDLKSFLFCINRCLHDYDYSRIDSWRKTVKRYMGCYPSYERSNDAHMDPNFLMHELSGFLPEDGVICADVGQNQIWAAQSLEIKRNQRFLTQGGMASMGSALSMAIGASFANPSKTIVVITGDGGFQLNLQELQTIYHHRLPIKIVLLNNSCYGMVRQFQKQYFNNRCQSTVEGYSAPDFHDIVSAYKISACTVRKNGEIPGALRLLFENNNPYFLEFMIDSNINCMPKLSVNMPVEEQEPLLPRKEFESLMIVEPWKHDEKSQ